MNNIKVFILMISMMALLVWVGYFFAGQGGMIIAFLIATAMNVVSYWFSDKLVLKMYKAKEISESDHPRLYRVVKRVCQNAGNMPMPKVCIVPSKAPNAFATGRNEDHAAVAVTEGLLEILSEDELEGVVAHEIGHIKNKDMLIGTVAATMAGAIGIIASIARWGAIFGGYGRSNERGGAAGLIVAAIVAPLIAIIIQMAISRQREFKADARAGRITGKYLPLASALEKLHKAPVRMNLDNKPATAHMMIANPLSGKGMSFLFSSHPPYEERIEKLKVLAQQSSYAGFNQP